MLQEQRHRMYRQQVHLPATAPHPGCGPHLAVLGRLRGTGCFDLEQVPHAPGLHLVQSGAGWLTTAGQGERSLAPGDAFIILPGERARYREDPRRPWRYTWLGFAGTGAVELLQAAGFAGSVRVLRGVATPALWQLCDEAEAAFSAASCSPFLAPGLAWRIAAALTPHRATAATAADPAAALRLLIDSGYDGSLSIAAAARRLSIDRSTLFRRFSAAYGCNPRAYLTRVRLTRARDLLQRGDDAVNAVAAACGYADARAFARAYRREFGYAPSSER
jgi:AraC-like DNA-binding protein